MLIIDNYAYTNKLRKTNPVLKAGLVLISLLLTMGLSNNYINISIILLMVFLTTKLAAIPMKNYLKILSLPLGFLAISMVTILFSISKTDIFIFSFNIFNRYVGISQESLGQGVNLFTRSIAAISSTFFLSLTTPLIELIRLCKKIKLPNVFIELTVLTYRFIFIFLEEAREIRKAQEMKFGYRNLKNSYKSIGLLIRALFIRVFLKYEDMIISLECKLYDGEFRIGD